MPESRALPSATHRCWRWVTCGLLAVALGLRIGLAATGGQNYWPDEWRYRAAVIAFHDFQAHQARIGWLGLIGSADHLLFKVLALPAAWMDATFGDSPERAAAYFGLFSVLALYFLYRCSRGIGATPRAAAATVFFGVCSSSLFYYSRHLLPYDVSLCLALAGLAVGLCTEAAGWAVVVGLFAGLGFLAYDGYWLLGGACLIWYVLRARSMAAGLARALGGAIGLVLPLAAAVLAAKALGGDLIKSFREFSGTITQGDFGQGYRFVFEYLWASEGWELAFWGLAAALALILSLRRKAWTPAASALAVTAGLYLTMVVFCDAAHWFVVYGRIARLMVPFVCLAAGWGVSEWVDSDSRGRWLSGMVVAGTVLVAGVHFASVLNLMFPDNFIRHAAKRAALPHSGLVRLLNANTLPGGYIETEDRPYRVLYAHDHPLQFRPYLFEGYVESTRRSFEEGDITMRLIEIPGVPVPQNPSGPISIRLRFPRGRDLYGEPLLSNGVPEAGDFLYVRYVDGAHVAFGYDSWGKSGFTSPSLSLDYTIPHELQILSPALGRGTGTQQEPRLKDHLVLLLDGEIIFATPVVSNPGLPHLGLNVIGGSTATESFSGKIESVTACPPEALVKRLGGIDSGSLRGDAAWAGFPGPLRIEIDPAKSIVAGTEPLVIAGTRASPAYLGLSTDRSGQTSLVFSNRRTGLAYSTALPEAGQHAVQLDVAWGALSPSNLGTAGRIVVWLNGRVVLAQPDDTVSPSPDSIELLSNLQGIGGLRPTFTRHSSIIPLSAAETAERVRIAPLSLGTSRPAVLDGYTGALKIRFTIPANGLAGSEPILATGTTGAGDLLYLQPFGAHQVRFGIDHWGSSVVVVSQPFVLDGKETIHELIVSSSALYPAASSAFFAKNPRSRGLLDRYYVSIDGRVVLDVPFRTFASAPDSFGVGFNAIGASTTGPSFSGTIVSVDSDDDPLAPERR